MNNLANTPVAKIYPKTRGSCRIVGGVGTLMIRVVVIDLDGLSYHKQNREEEKGPKDNY